MRGAGWQGRLHSALKFSRAACGWSGWPVPLLAAGRGLQRRGALRTGTKHRGSTARRWSSGRTKACTRPLKSRYGTLILHRAVLLPPHAESHTAGHSTVDLIPRVTPLASGAKTHRPAAESLLCWLCERSHSNHRGNRALVCNVAAQARGRCRSCSQATNLSPGCVAAPVLLPWVGAVVL